MKSLHIREKFLDFFKKKGHKIEPSASLVPVDDPSLLWINSGVATLKKYFDGRLVPENPRIVNVQKSIRTNDIENVGYTSRHHTFFEMLGNFSIGDYFKEEAICWAFEFLTSKAWLNLDKNRLFVTIHPKDTEAFDIWHKKVGLDKEKIFKNEDNFWDLGQGPSGPNTEIFFDRGSLFGKGKDVYPGGENERFLEIWNLVFSQYNHNLDGSYTPLPKKNIDTGMGLERIASVLQNVNSNYETDLFSPIIKFTCELCNVDYGKDKEIDVALRVIADHIRTVTFAISDGVFPSNESRGYVLRRLIRRAVRFGKILNFSKPFLYKHVEVVANIMGSFYTELLEKISLVEMVVKEEEERFFVTLNEGLRMLEDLYSKALQSNKREVCSEDVFKLYDTYGFPVELTEEFLLQKGLSFEKKAFEKQLEKQRERSKSKVKAIGGMQVQQNILADLEIESQFVGYIENEVKATIKLILKDNVLADKLEDGKAILLLDKTPFYAESGGQVSDKGKIVTEDGSVLLVEDVQKGPKGQHLHFVTLKKGKIFIGQKVLAMIDGYRRQKIRRNHTATHLLHRALKDVLGKHANQAGSLVLPNKLRFDFSHYDAVTKEQLSDIERRVNQKIWESLDVTTSICKYEEALKKGATALFSEKYKDVVRVVAIDSFSLELCAGTHVKNTSEIGFFKILSEGSIGSGIRRIEAITSDDVYFYVDKKLQILENVANKLKTQEESVLKKVQMLLEDLRKVTTEKETLQTKLNDLKIKEILKYREEIKGVPLVVAKIKAENVEDLRKFMDNIKQRFQGIIVLNSVINKKAVFLVSVFRKYIELGIKAVDLAKYLASLCNGSGGGKAEIAQAGSKDVINVDNALRSIPLFIQKKIN